jgi:hypothetical protein
MVQGLVLHHDSFAASGADLPILLSFFNRSVITS